MSAPNQKNNFSQVEAVSRCRKVKEDKIQTGFGLLKLADEEVTVHNDNLDEAFHTLRTQTWEKHNLLSRQESEANDTIEATGRKLRLSELVDKLRGLKSALRFSEETHKRLMGVKELTMQKRAAFLIRLSGLELRQTLERNELMMAQLRVAQTVAQIRGIEFNSIKDVTERRRKQTDNDFSIQQAQMKAQKECEQLREIQLCKVKHMGEFNDLDIANMEEIEDLLAFQKEEEFTMVAKHITLESEAGSAFNKQKNTLEAHQLLSRQKENAMQKMRAERRQAKQVSKVNRVALKQRERAYVAENGILSSSIKDDGEAASDDDGTSSQGSTSQRASAVSLSLTDNTQGTNDDEEEDDAIKTAGNSEAQMNAARNAVNNNGTFTEEESELKTMIDIGRERQRALETHHRKELSELRAQHKAQLSAKQREHRKKLNEVTRDHEEEIETLKAEQESDMSDLLRTQALARDQQTDTQNSLNVLGMMLPAHILAEIEAGKTPEPTEFSKVTIFFTDIHQFKTIVASVDSVLILNLLSALYTKFDDVIAKYDSLYKVECVADTYMVCSGLSSNHGDKTEEEILADTEAALRCIKELQEVVGAIDMDSLGIHEFGLQIRVGVHSGPVFAGLVGNKMSRYCLFGDSVNTASRMCTNSEAGCTLISPSTYEIVKDCSDMQFEDREGVEVKGKGKMNTYWFS
ncbi:hypothetical protein HDV05_000328 [Chytridiales sp. JEL 0842]|nr:hypothetical protein HDV05_000328 [Chytridiales sp. JEL 0842]